MASLQNQHPHAELIATLDEFYTLLVTTGAFDSSDIFRPDPATGKHKDGTIQTQAALAAGYDPETVDLMCYIPYATDSRHESFNELLPNTYPVTYRGADLDQGYYESLREMLNDEAIMPPTALRLSWNEICGFVFIYDSATKLMVAWEPAANPVDVDDYFHVAAASPREVLGPIIKDYRSLKYLAAPDRTNFQQEGYGDSGGVPPKDWPARDQKNWLKQYRIWNASQKLRELMVECGWNTESITQDAFRREEYMQKRDRYWAEVVQPLIDAEESD
ncbi:hypothetical protein BD289DRAFT_12730 [Coniella lustricola]|uniref:Uncharacterized protein n=1 Tax=Coniella lustricola TaxID=2025994 RepID=A0A2T3A4B8_9PEZI|nr:hypothetical protein BD289DRAFT_12730 [Coniella lustricola]